MQKMNKGYYLIGEVSKITGISKDTLHFYSKTGLLVPEHIDERNQYRYYSRFNLWQLDIITTCRKLGISLEKIRQILAFHDNTKITELLMEYRNEALRLAEYYRQAAEDILWYDHENRRISSTSAEKEVRMEYLEEETVIAGILKRDINSYHANLQEAAKDELRHADTIQRKYGYFLDVEQMRQGRIYKLREYLKIPDSTYSHTEPDNLYTIPKGNYAVCIVRIINGTADFSLLFQWLKQHGYTTDAVYAEEMGLQLFDYIDDFYCEIKAHLSTEKSKTPLQATGHQICNAAEQRGI